MYIAAVGQIDNRSITYVKCHYISNLVIPFGILHIYYSVVAGLSLIHICL